MKEDIPNCDVATVRPSALVERGIRTITELAGHEFDVGVEREDGTHQALNYFNRARW
jgi:hypothetical protein